MNEAQTSAIDAYLNGTTVTDLPDPKARAADTKERIARTAAIRQVLTAISDDLKAQAELYEAEAVLDRAMGNTGEIEVIVPENVPLLNRLSPVMPVTAIVVVVSVLGLVAWAIA